MLAGFFLMVLSEQRLLRAIALGISLIELAFSLVLLFLFDDQLDGFQLAERYDWIPSLNIQYLVGLDGISLVFMPLTALLTSAVILASWNSVQSQLRLYFTLILALESFTLGIYASIDLGLFFLFWELSIVPIFFLASFWGIGPKRRHAAFKYAMFMLTGGVLLLFAFALLAINHAHEASLTLPAGFSFDYTVLLETHLPAGLQSVIFFLLFIGFAVKAPLFPFHIWLPTMAMEGPAGLSALLMGMKLGLFGIIRFAIPLAPQAADQHFGLMAWLGVIGAVYGALMALKQSNLRAMLAYSSISHVGLVLIGIAAFNMQGIQGAVFQLFNFGIVSGCIFLIAGFLQHRLGSTDLSSLGGIAKSMPMLSSAFFILGLASIGVPGTNGFIAEHLIAIGALSAHIGMGIAVLFSAILSAAYFLGFFQKGFLGALKFNTVKDSVDLRVREAIIAFVMVFVAIILGLYPKPMLDLTQKPAKAWLSRVQSEPVSTMLARD